MAEGNINISNLWSKATWGTTLTVPYSMNIIVFFSGVNNQQEMWLYNVEPDILTHVVGLNRTLTATKNSDGSITFTVDVAGSLAVIAILRLI